MAEVDGKYKISMKTPMGVKDGYLTIDTSGGDVSGVLTILGKDNPYSGGTQEGNTVKFSGTFASIMGKTPYDGEGTIDGDAIDGVSHTKMGDMPLVGTRE
jgi:hypothetical protein